jgi:MoaA/NifB/PqqE/SkfB family radical SAM enzyme
MEKEVCWNITARCNQSCKYCHRFNDPKDLSFDENKKVLDNLIESHISNITWTGGEALLVDNLDVLLKISHENGIKNKLITNGRALTKEVIDKIYKYLDNLTLSIDSINNKTNELIGRGKNHYKEIKDILDYLKKKKYDFKLCINIVVCKFNLNDIEDLIKFLNNYNIYSLRLFKFMPLREKAIVNKDMFEISDSEYEKVVNYVIDNSSAKRIDTRITSDMQNKYILILANGDIILTNDNGDNIMGNALIDKIESYK